MGGCRSSPHTTAPRAVQPHRGEGGGHGENRERFDADGGGEVGRLQEILTFKKPG